jgi:Uma2 family endonuclease
MATKALMTVEEFVQMDTADNETYELVDGELIPLSSATPLHSIIRGRAEQLVRNYFDSNPIGGAMSETDCRIGGDTVRKPDLSIFLGERWQKFDLKKVPVPFSPDIAVEILSPSEHAMDVNRKVREYLAAGSQEMWLFDPENGEVHVRTNARFCVIEGRSALESPLLPGFSVGVAALLAGR